MLPLIIGGALGAIGSSLLNNLGASARQSDAQRNAELQSQVQYDRTKELAATQWSREQEAATTAYGRQQELQEGSWEHAHGAATTQYEREQEAAGQAFLRSQQAATTQAERAEAAAVAAHSRSVDAYKQRYQWTVEDMKKAGLNPILAATGGFQVGSGVQSPASIPQMASVMKANAQAARGGMGSAQMARSQMGSADLGKTMMHPWFPVDLGGTARDVAGAFKMNKELDLIDANVKKTKQDTKLSFQNIKESVQRIQESRARQGVLTQEEKVMAQEMFNREKVFEKIGHEIELLIQNLVNERLSEKEKRKNLQLIELRFGKMGQEIKELELLVGKMEHHEKAYRGLFGTILGYIKAYREALGISLSGHMGSTSSAVKMLR